LRADGVALEGAPAELLETQETWEDPIVEGPSMTRDQDGVYHLLYSGGRWESAEYAVGSATCDSPLGPCRRGSAAPVLQQSGDVAGPGGAEFFAGPGGETWIAFHAWMGAVGYPQGRRSLLIERAGFEGGQLFLDQPTTAEVRFDHDPVPPPPSVDPSPPDAPASLAPSVHGELAHEASSPPVAAAPVSIAPASTPTPARPPSGTGRASAPHAATAKPSGAMSLRNARHDDSAPLFAALIANVGAAAACVTTMIGQRRSRRRVARTVVS
jgi:hypothetical protein